MRPPADIVRGPDHSHFGYEADPQRKPVEWPNGARIAFWVVLHLEYYELEPPNDSLQDPRYAGEFGNYRPDYRTYSRREYGNRIGLFRILDCLERHRIRATVAANAMVLERRRCLGELCHARSHEICAHSIAASRLVTSRCSQAEERQIIRRAQQAVIGITGRHPQGWISQDFGESARTPTLLAESGFSWVSDWPNDDRPYLMTTSPAIVSIPYQNEWDDANVMEVFKRPAWTWREIATRAFEQLYAEGGRVFGLGIHPWVAGQPHRVRYLDELLSWISGKPSVWKATGSEIAAAFRSAP